MKSTLVIALGALFLTAAAVSAQTAPAAPASKMTAAHHATGATAKPRSAASLACSKQADAMKVHGKKRKTYMSSCKKAGGPK